MTTSEAKQRLCDWLKSQVGYREGINNWNKYAEIQGVEQLYGIRIQNLPWCDILTDAAFISCFGLEKGAAMTYQRVGRGSALCRDSAQYFVDNGAFTMLPEIGDVVFFYYDGDINHMGIVVDVSGDCITVVEGNANDMVIESTYRIDDSIIAGYGRPRWDLVADEEKADFSAAKEKKGFMNGVDISHYQQGLTIRQIWEAGKGFAIIKITEGSYLKDGSAFNFYKEAYETGFPVGAYCYSHALTIEQAMAEGAFMIKTINNFPMPCGIFLDMEDDKQLALSKDQLLAVIRGWCASIGGAGYIPGVYSSAGTLWSKISPDELPVGTLVWVAQWSSAPPSMRCDLWQNSDSGRIDGYTGPVDTDVAISDYFKTLVSNASYGRKESTEVQEEQATDAPTITKPDPIIMTLQLILSYENRWGEPDGQRSREFFDALKLFVNDLERGK